MSLSLSAYQLDLRSHNHQPTPITSLGSHNNLYQDHKIFIHRQSLWPENIQLSGNHSINLCHPPTHKNIYNILSQPPVVCSQNTIKNRAQTDGILFTEKLIVLCIWVGNRYSDNTEHMPGDVTGVKCWVYLVSACRVQDVQR